MLGKVSLISAVALGLGLSAAAPAQTQNAFELEKRQKEQHARGVRTAPAGPLEALMVELKDSGLQQPYQKLELVQARIADQPGLLKDAKTALPLWELQTQLVIDYVNGLEVRNGAERIRLLNEELARLKEHNKAVKELFLKEGGK